jgi:mannose-6-phosphate isomerase
MGTHISSPSTTNTNGSGAVPLSEHLAANSELCGDALNSKFPEIKKGNLPFLLKVLSIEKALSIQSHPDKKTAEVLHAKFPKIYKGQLSFHWHVYILA